MKRRFETARSRRTLSVFCTRAEIAAELQAAQSAPQDGAPTDTDSSWSLSVALCQRKRRRGCPGTQLMRCVCRRKNRTSAARLGTLAAGFFRHTSRNRRGKSKSGRRRGAGAQRSANKLSPGGGRRRCDPTSHAGDARRRPGFVDACASAAAKRCSICRRRGMHITRRCATWMASLAKRRGSGVDSIAAAKGMSADEMWAKIGCEPLPAV